MYVKKFVFVGLWARFNNQECVTHYNINYHFNAIEINIKHLWRILQTIFGDTRSSWAHTQQGRRHTLCRLLCVMLYLSAVEMPNTSWQQKNWLPSAWINQSSVLIAMQIWQKPVLEKTCTQSLDASLHGNFVLSDQECFGIEKEKKRKNVYSN